MRVYAISDLHLSFDRPVVIGDWEHISQYKPMEIFGRHWEDHPRRLYENWCATVSPEDYVLVGGDISWGLKLEDCRFDFDFIGQLPGHIILGRGNHDYWWQGQKKVAAALPENVIPLHHQAYALGSKTICSTRGWTSPGSKDYHGEDVTLYNREMVRLEMALQEGAKLGGEQVVLFHFRPTNEKMEKSGFIELMEAYHVKTCIYGHLHGEDSASHLPEEKWGIEFRLTSADFLKFNPLYLWEE